MRAITVAFGSFFLVKLVFKLIGKFAPYDSSTPFVGMGGLRPEDDL